MSVECKLGILKVHIKQVSKLLFPHLLKYLEDLAFSLT